MFTGQTILNGLCLLGTNLFRRVRVAQCRFIENYDHGNIRFGIEFFDRLKTLIERLKIFAGLCNFALITELVETLYLFRQLCFIGKRCGQDAQHHDQSEYNRKNGSCSFHPCILLIKY